MNPITNVLKKLLKPYLFPNSKQAMLDKADVLFTCSKAAPIIKCEPTLLCIDGPIVIVGDVHGQFSDLVNIFDQLGHVPKQKYIFMGDYVGRGTQSVEVLTLLFALKIKYPNHIYLLRGNHETEQVSALDGFADEIKDKGLGDVWYTFNELFKWMPLAAVINRRIFCVHGGISPDLHSLRQISAIKKPIKVGSSGLVCDMLWSDPSLDENGFQKNLERDISVIYGPDVVEDFLKANRLDLLCRGHQVVPEGYEFPYDSNKSTVTISSVPSDRDQGAVMVLDDRLELSFVTFPCTEQRIDEGTDDEPASSENTERRIAPVYDEEEQDDSYEFEPRNEAYEEEEESGEDF